MGRLIQYSLLFFLGFVLLPDTVWSQTEPIEGLRDNTPAVHAFTGATIVVAPGEVLDDATLVIRDGVVDAVGSSVTPPPDARVWEMEGKTLYPGFIDAHSDIGMQEPREELDRGATSWNVQLRAMLDASDEYDREDDGSEELRSQGVATALSVPPLGIFRGHVAAVNLSDGPVSNRVVQRRVAHSVSLHGSRELGYTYPTSAMGGISFIRQMLLDADWYERAHDRYASDPEGLERPETNAALAALEEAVNGDQPLLFEAETEEEVLRSLRFGDEFDIDLWVRGSGHEYRIIDVLADVDAPLILPVDFPEEPDVDTPEDALSQSLADLRHWYLAPENPARLEDAGIPFSFTADGLEDRTDFLPNIRKSVERGLTPEAALAALTTNPADMLGFTETHGTLEQGKLANVVVSDGDLFDEGSTVLDVWVEGKRFIVNDAPVIDPRGEWQISAADGSIDGTLQVEGSPDNLSGTMTVGGVEVELSSAHVRHQARRFRVAFPGDTLGLGGPVRLSASVSGDALVGWSELPGGERVAWEGLRTASFDEEDEPDETESPTTLDLADIRPAMEYGRDAFPEQPNDIIVRGATIWTMGPDGTIDNADLRVTQGEIVEVGSNLQAPSGAVEIDGQGKHVTPGLIDAHIHSGTDGVNEIGSAAVPEVDLGDVLTINNIWMYRQLAGGLTAAHVMHGSANPIGGQNQHIKMRWGALADDLKLEGAPRTVKFALGENPKRVGQDRYPETRMGTEQIIAEHFRAAEDYRQRWEEWEQSGEGIPPRRDLRMEALVDILEGDILIQSHSYRQDEILMLTRLAEQFDLPLRAFHHAVEAYKVAPELAEAGIGAVVWSDWGGFKIEAYDNTTYNARLLHEAGVLTSLHSDNSQIAARMNWEAAKMVRAGMDEEDALAMVTINTATILGIDDRVGSLEPGKDADFVLWSGHPLSSFTRAEETWVDGRKQFDLDDDAVLHQQVEQQRSDLIRLIVEEN